ncbi:hypothetical protein [Vibrio alfacsensis]|uniref:hypothetical protein n=1 Tax=Vibrio alfacsensis TaxID=1074311 RepID=UPI004068229B
MSENIVVSESVIQELEVQVNKTSYYVYQTIDGSVLWAATNFIRHVVRNKKSLSTRATYRQAVRSLFMFLSENKIRKTWEDMDDELLGKYADWQLERSIKNVRYRGDINASMRNVNHDYLMPIYEFYFWAQDQGLHSMLLGEHSVGGKRYQITSALARRDKDSPKQKFLYPKLFSNCGENNERKGQLAEDWEIEELKDYIRSHYEGYERASLLLMVRIGKETGSRNIALSGYTRLQFCSPLAERELMSARTVFEVTPLKQKGGNTMPVKFPLSLVNGVISFINNEWQEFIDSTKFKHHDSHLFLDVSDGKPLSAKNITEIFSRITRALGWPKGKSFYSLRHRYANEQMDVQVAINDELGFTKEENAVALQVSENMTHRSKMTLIKEYLESRSRQGYKTKVHQQAELIQELKAQKDDLLLEIQRLIEITEEQQEMIALLQNKLVRTV